MIIGGIQKLSLIDFPGKISTVIFTQGCDFFCPFCHNPDLLPFLKDGAILESDFFDHISKNLKMIEGVCITGGEPTMQPDLPLFIRKIKELGLSVKLDTNGSSPETLQKLFESKALDYVAMDIKTTWDNYALAIRSKNPEMSAQKAKESLSVISSSGVDHEFRTTVFPGVHKMDDFISMAGYLRDGEKYFIQNIRLEKTLGNITPEEKISAADVASRIKEKYPNLIVDWR
ncbi:MAG: anaerobic ribonucleoside-triphosphate reductase activating protein [Candidatus Colwellbacteria bacterium]|nr:anaerobic ribonucleoside-triphosphate reductase activating protein [Candidatus Colwellbacteria bacterium]